MDEKSRVVPLRNPNASGCISGLRIGRVVGIDGNGRFFIVCERDGQSHRAASLTSSARERLLHGDATGTEVLLWFDSGDPDHPIIIDTLSSPVDEAAQPPSGPLEAEHPDEVLLDRKRLIFEAEEEVVLRCGEASITLTNAGKVLIKGCYVVSRASGTNAIKGSSVRIN